MGGVGQQPQVLCPRDRYGRETQRVRPPGSRWNPSHLSPQEPVLGQPQGGCLSNLLSRRSSPRLLWLSLRRAPPRGQAGHPPQTRSAPWDLSSATCIMACFLILQRLCCWDFDRSALKLQVNLGEY